LREFALLEHISRIGQISERMVASMEVCRRMKQFQLSESIIGWRIPMPRRSVLARHSTAASLWALNIPNSEREQAISRFHSAAEIETNNL